MVCLTFHVYKRGEETGRVSPHRVVQWHKHLIPQLTQKPSQEHSHLLPGFYSPLCLIAAQRWTGVQAAAPIRLPVEVTGWSCTEWIFAQDDTFNTKKKKIKFCFPAGTNQTRYSRPVPEISVNQLRSLKTSWWNPNSHKCLLLFKAAALKSQSASPLTTDLKPLASRQVWLTSAVTPTGSRLN